MKTEMNRRAFLRFAGLGGVVFVSSRRNQANAANHICEPSEPDCPFEDFCFVQLSDTHWGFSGPTVNPDAGGTLKKAVAAVNGLKTQPDFIVFTGDLTHTTEDPRERRRRMAEFRDIVSALKVKHLRFLPGEHDASLDRGQAYREFFGEPNYSFDHRGVHFVALDNASDPAGRIGDSQLRWLSKDLSGLRPDAPIVVFSHRPLFDLYPQWDWATRDGAKAIELLTPFSNVTVFYGHIHQGHHHLTGRIPHHAAKSLMFPLPAPGSQPVPTPIPWDIAEPYKGLGFRSAAAEALKTLFVLTEFPAINHNSHA